LFAAFYTTKSNGMKMGISISRSIMEAYRRRITGSANHAAGVTLIGRLPAQGLLTFR
jgi:C4-dicarboxylate-specific signal transduction histidine kinase